jgi:hypothetical protein
MKVAAKRGRAKRAKKPAAARAASNAAPGEAMRKEPRMPPPTHSVGESLARIESARNGRKLEFARTPAKTVYWASLIVLLVCNLVVAVVLIPFILVLTSLKFYLLVALLAFIFGFLFNIIINDIEHIETKHHVFAIIFIPLVAIINITIMIGVSNRIAGILGLLKYQDPLQPAILYALIFLLPYAVSLLREENRHRQLHV